MYHWNCVAQVGIQFMVIILFLSPKFWDYGCVSHCARISSILNATFQWL